MYNGIQLQYTYYILYSVYYTTTSETSSTTQNAKK